MIELEADYRSIGVGEIVLFYPNARKATILRKRNGDYDVETLTQGEFNSEAVQGFHLNIEWMFEESLPDEIKILNDLISEAG